MIPQELTDENRRALRARFMTRVKRTTDPEWRRFWETEVLFLDNRNAEAVSVLCELGTSRNDEVAVAALSSLGEWWEQSGAVDLAHAAYGEAIERDARVSSSAGVRTKLARLHNQAGRPELAMSVLKDIAAALETVPADVVQFVVTEYCRALRHLGRDDDARSFIRRATASFPARGELALLERHLLG